MSLIIMQVFLSIACKEVRSAVPLLENKQKKRIQNDWASKENFWLSRQSFLEGKQENLSKGVPV